MTALHSGAAGEVPGGVIFVPEQQVPETDQTAPHGNRRWFLGLAGGGAVAVAGAVVLPRWLNGGSGGSGGNGGQTGGGARLAEGGGGAVGAAGAMFEKPAVGDIPIDGTNIHHILEVTQNSDDINRRLDALFGTPDLTYINPGSDMRYAWLQISARATGASLTMSLRQAGAEIAPGERVPTWAEAVRPATAPIQLYPDTVVSYNDQFPSGRTIANITGWTNIGTPNERMFTVDTQHMPTLAGLTPEARQTEVLNFTHALFQARVLG